jgi:hypothetical protein
MSKATTTTAAEPKQTVTVDVRPGKELLIRYLQESKPQVIFTGDWCKKEMLVTLRAIKQAYHDYQIQRRKTGVLKFHDGGDKC